MEIFAKLFGGTGKVKVLRLFLLNPEAAFDAPLVAAHANVETATARRLIALLARMRLIKRRTFSKELKAMTAQGVPRRKRAHGWTLNQHFPYLSQLRSLLVNIPPLDDDEIIRRLSRAGKIKVVIISGIFIQEDDSRVDLLVVGDSLRNAALENAVRLLESEVGKELRYAAFETSQFRYRVSIYDRLIRDILDYPHRVVLDRVGLSAVRPG